MLPGLIYLLFFLSIEPSLFGAGGEEAVQAIPFRSEPPPLPRSQLKEAFEIARSISQILNGQSEGNQRNRKEISELNLALTNLKRALRTLIETKVESLSYRSKELQVIKEETLQILKKLEKPYFHSLIPLRSREALWSNLDTRYTPLERIHAPHCPNRSVLNLPHFELLKELRDQKDEALCSASAASELIDSYRFAYLPNQKRSLISPLMLTIKSEQTKIAKLKEVKETLQRQREELAKASHEGMQSEVQNGGEGTAPIRGQDRSPLALAHLRHEIRSGEQMKRDLEKILEEDPLDRGEIAVELIALAKEKGVCLESIHYTQMKRDEGHESFVEMTHRAFEGQNPSVDLLCHLANRGLLFPVQSFHSKIQNILRLSEDQRVDLAFKAMNETCQEEASGFLRELPDPIVQTIQSEERLAQVLKAHFENHAGKEQPIGIAVCADFMLKPESFARAPRCTQPDHEMNIVGLSWNETTQKCEAMIKNTHSQNCGAALEWADLCLDGILKIDLKTLSHGTSEAFYFPPPNLRGR